MRLRLLIGLGALLVVLGVGACAEPTPTAGPGHPVAQDLFNRLNAERAARGLPALVWDDNLAATATDWAGQMSANGIGHNPNLGGGVGENVSAGYGASTDVHLGWMGSDGHRRNLLSDAYETVGIGVACVNGQIYAVEDFRMRGDATSVGGVPAAQPVSGADGPAVGC
jgi:uncharacterized protein YkwD